MTQQNNDAASPIGGASPAGGTVGGIDMLTMLKNRSRKITIGDGNEQETFYRVEGDLLLDEDQFEMYARQNEALEKERALRFERAALGAADVAPQEGRSALVAVSIGGKLARWKPGLVLTYCVLKNTFGSDAKYQMVKNNIKQAMWEWESICGIKFEHKEELDNSATTKPDGVIFTVREIDAQGQFIAAAFFPTDPKNRRRVLIDPSYYSGSLGFDKVGVLRHELGHVLGFRHEHIRSQAPAICPDEDLDNTINLTDYDPQSVMHYFCGNVGSSALAITDVDKIGAQKLYGLSFDSFTYVE